MGRFGVLLAGSGVLRRGAALFALALAVSLIGAASASAQAPRVLVFHGPSDAVNDAGVAALEAIGAANSFEVDPTADAATFTTSNLAGYRAVVFLNNDGDRLNAAQETALQGYIEGGGGFVGIGRAAEAEPASTFVSGLIGARPATGSPTATSEQVVAVGDRVHPATKSLPLEWTRSDVWYQWTSRPTGQVHTRGALPRSERARRRRDDHRRHRLADLLVPRLPGRPLLLHRHGPHRGHLRRDQLPRPPAGRDPMERRPRARRLQGHDRRQLHRRAAGRRVQRQPRAHRRVPRRRAGAERLGDLHRPRRLPDQ